MLANSYKTAEELGISQIERDALISILHQIQLAELKLLTYSNFSFKPAKNTIDMTSWFSSHSCGTVGCLAGTAHLQTDGKAFPELKKVFENVSCGHPGIFDETTFLMERLPSHLAGIFVNIQGTPTEIVNDLQLWLTTGECLNDRLL